MTEKKAPAEKEVPLGGQPRRIKDRHDAAGIATETFGINPEESKRIEI
ncbi:hypothetical protein GTO89_07455 [Heliobacterium gestii]|uniref:Uncharacterized protein n=1 Tax=Heliomicrobium gestii TaxID=2699 RepID=A0A845LEK1_HELGE|nr:hypothetical protein [Heliomicrobium gestii]MBM7866340.1 hypothetical protein [Heliomicrobium gestii]MZP42875.1 hypothetical protein [Heliomicrobium gestii]